jgi:small subunit ribosomal protein S20
LANTKSAIKRIRSSRRKRQHNLITRGRARTSVKKARALIAQNSEGSDLAVKLAISELDRAAGKGVIHKNNAARRKSRLLKLLAVSR